MDERKPTKCFCGTESVVKLTSDNLWAIYCPHCHNVVVDGNDRRTQTYRVKVPRKELFERWEARNQRLERERNSK